MVSFALTAEEHPADTGTKPGVPRVPESAPVYKDGESPLLWSAIVECWVWTSDQNGDDGGRGSDGGHAARSVGEVEIQDQEFEHHRVDQAGDGGSRGDDTNGEALLLLEPRCYDWEQLATWRRGDSTWMHKP